MEKHYRTSALPESPIYSLLLIQSAKLDITLGLEQHPELPWVLLAIEDQGFKSLPCFGWRHDDERATEAAFDIALDSISHRSKSARRICEHSMA